MGNHLFLIFHLKSCYWTIYVSDIMCLFFVRYVLMHFFSVCCRWQEHKRIKQQRTILVCLRCIWLVWTSKIMDFKIMTCKLRFVHFSGFTLPFIEDIVFIFFLEKSQLSWCEILNWIQLPCPQIHLALHLTNEECWDYCCLEEKPNWQYSLLFLQNNKFIVFDFWLG